MDTDFEMQHLCAFSTLLEKLIIYCSTLLDKNVRNTNISMLFGMCQLIESSSIENVSWWGQEQWTNAHSVNVTVIYAAANDLYNYTQTIDGLEFIFMGRNGINGEAMKVMLFLY